MDVARLNMSHGTHEDHARGLPAGPRRPPTRAATASASSPTSRARRSGSRRFADGPVAADDRARSGRSPPATSPGDAEICGTTYKGLPGDVNAGDPILIDDGKVRLRVTDVGRRHRRAHRGAGRRQGQQQQGHQPARRRRVGARRCRRRTSRTCAGRCTSTVDFIALSFVRSAADVEDVRKIMARRASTLPVIAKIEKPQAIENLDEIIDAFDGFMVARGDLGVECPLEDVPFLQKQIIDKARRQRQAGHRRDPDARVDDLEPARRPAPRPPTSPTRSSTAPTR